MYDRLWKNNIGRAVMLSSNLRLARSSQTCTSAAHFFLHTPYPYHDFPGRNKGDQNSEQTCDSRPRDLLSICNCSGSCMVSCVAYFVWHVNVSSHVQFSGWRTEGVSDTCADGCTSWSRRQFFGTNSPNVGFESKTTLTICTQPFPHA